VSKLITALLLQEANRSRIRLRAVGAARAVVAGASVDAVVTHGHLSSEPLFNNFYRLSSTIKLVVVFFNTK